MFKLPEEQKFSGNLIGKIEIGGFMTSTFQIRLTPLGEGVQSEASYG